MVLYDGGKHAEEVSFSPIVPFRPLSPGRGFATVARDAKIPPSPEFDAKEKKKGPIDPNCHDKLSRFPAPS